MNADTQKAIQVLCDKIRTKEEEADGLKRIVNGLCTDEGQQPMFPSVGSGHSSTIHSIRSDQFYGQTLAEAAGEYLGIRKCSGLGAATVLEIYEALKAGGYK